MIFNEKYTVFFLKTLIFQKILRINSGKEFSDFRMGTKCALTKSMGTKCTLTKSKVKSDFCGKKGLKDFRGKNKDFFFVGKERATLKVFLIGLYFLDKLP